MFLLQVVMVVVLWIACGLLTFSIWLRHLALLTYEQRPELMVPRVWHKADTGWMVRWSLSQDSVRYENFVLLGMLTGPLGMPVRLVIWAGGWAIDGFGRLIEGILADATVVTRGIDKLNGR